MIGTQQIRVLKHQQALSNFNMLLSVNCDFRILVLPNTLIEPFQPDRLDSSQRTITY